MHSFTKCVFIIATSIIYSSCIHKPIISNDVDERIFGTWKSEKVFFEPVEKYKKMNHYQLTIMNISRNKFKIISQVVLKDIVLCEAEVSTSKFKLTENGINFTEEKNTINEGKMTSFCIAYFNFDPYYYKLIDDKNFEFKNNTGDTQILNRID